MSQETNLEDRIMRLKHTLPKDHVILKRQPPEQQAENLIDYLIKGVNIGYSTFYTYRTGYIIYNIVKHNINEALLSPEPFIRQMALIIRQQGVEIPPPKQYSN